MLEKASFYHGAAIIDLISHKGHQSIKRHQLGSYIINDCIYLAIKYSTKSRTPWGFVFDSKDLERYIELASNGRRLFLALVCGGDGICAVSWEEARKALEDKPGRIAVGRRHNESYSVWGSEGEIQGKISQKRWPGLLFEI